MDDAALIDLIDKLKI